MKATHCTKDDLEKALELTNEKYDGNIIFNPDSDLPDRFTLRVNGDGKGRVFSLHSFRMGWNKKPRKTSSACWHVHGDFFDALFNVRPDAVVYSRGSKITVSSGNWEDFNVGSQVCPIFASEQCECENKIE